MEDPLDQVYGKSDKGRAELESRTRTLTGHLRTALILVDGRSSLKALGAKIGPDAPAVIAALARAGYVEMVEAPKARPKEVAPAPPPKPEPAPAPPPAPAEDLVDLQRAAINLLASHFGPDVMIVVKPLLDATTRQAFNDGLNGIERKLAVYVGKGQASRILAELRS